MKVRFYCDVPPYDTSGGWNHYACNSKPMSIQLPEGWRRVSFVVDLPVKDFDVEAEVCEVSVEVGAK